MPTCRLWQLDVALRQPCKAAVISEYISSAHTVGLLSVLFPSAKKVQHGKLHDKQEIQAPAAITETVCRGVNIYKNGEDPMLKEDSQYPDWLWNLLEPKKSYEELSPDTKQYWRRHNKCKAHEHNELRKQLG